MTYVIIIYDKECCPMQTRQSRMDKYYDSDIDIDDSSVVTSRTKKNQELYKEVGTLDLEDFDLNNNVSIIR